MPDLKLTKADINKWVHNYQDMIRAWLCEDWLTLTAQVEAYKTQNENLDREVFKALHECDELRAQLKNAEAEVSVQAATIAKYQEDAGTAHDYMDKLAAESQALTAQLNAARAALHSAYPALHDMIDFIRSCRHGPCAIPHPDEEFTRWAMRRAPEIMAKHKLDDVDAALSAARASREPEQGIAP